jgi:hypothetical protein
MPVVLFLELCCGEIWQIEPLKPNFAESQKNKDFSARRSKFLIDKRMEIWYTEKAIKRVENRRFLVEYNRSEKAETMWGPRRRCLNCF